MIKNERSPLGIKSFLYKHSRDSGDQRDTEDTKRVIKKFQICFDNEPFPLFQESVSEICQQFRDWE